MIVVIEFGTGNTALLENVLTELKCDFLISNREFDICNSEKIILAMGGEALPSLRKMHMLNLFNLLRVIKKPLLGIGLGMQLLCEKSKEGDTAGLGIFPASTEKFDESKVEIPHTGMFTVECLKKSRLFDDIGTDDKFYFNHSYYTPKNEFTTSICTHGLDFSASIEKDNLYGVQFHPQNSGQAGVRLIKNFIDKCC